MFDVFECTYSSKAVILNHELNGPEKIGAKTMSGRVKKQNTHIGFHTPWGTLHNWNIYIMKISHLQP